ncbi:MAG: malto-oligosyltrehalose trehalohydrolase [Planctomycetales bacterium]|nr:malto-oligosyltrehalose trehalohydrolase [Planctomycetales bacterium]
MESPTDHHPILATDLDGTLIPVSESDSHRRSLTILKQLHSTSSLSIVFVTGRHLASVEQAIDQFGLPQADWIICDVGTSIYRRVGGEYALVQGYRNDLEKRVTGYPQAKLRDRLSQFDNLTAQEAEKQGVHKLSFYVPADRLDDLVVKLETFLQEEAAPYSLIHSIDPFCGVGLIDFLPTGVSKSYALDWWTDYTGHAHESIVFAGDSGNDLAAFTSGYRSIVVANADRRIARQAYDAHQQAGWRDRLYLASRDSTTGIVEGCRWFGLLPAEPPRDSALGAVPIQADSTYFRVWAPKRMRVEVELVEQRKKYPLARQEFGYFHGTVPGASSGTQYLYSLDGQVSRPDPVSRFQPHGVHGPSQVVNPAAFPWTDQQWRGVAKQDLVIYEMHVGALTEEGSFRAAIDQIDSWKDLGITAVEMMPVAQTPGKWNWGYDGVGLFAVRNTYGSPDDLKAFVDACHAAEIAVILDVVYNHVGPEGNYLSDFGPYASRKHGTPWGDALNYDGRHARHVREFVVRNAMFWLDEYHLDGLRLDAVHFVFDESEPHILDEIRRETAAFEQVANRKIHLIAEANTYNHKLLHNGDGNLLPYDASWSDCVLHSVYSLGAHDVRLTPRDYNGRDDIVEALTHGYLYTGPQIARATPASRATTHANGDRSYLSSLVVALQTHDSVGNHPHGKRLHQITSVAFQNAAAALVLLYPTIPLIFMGEERSSESLFPFFVDFEDPRIRQAVDRGRAGEFPQHAWEGAISPSDPRAFQAAKYHDRHADTPTLHWYRQLLNLRKQGVEAGWLTPAQLSVEHDVACGRISLRYGTRFVLHVRLTAPGEELEPCRVPLEGDLVLQSCGENVEVAGKTVIFGQGPVAIGLLSGEK